jgi:hypothetical protein
MRAMSIPRRIPTAPRLDIASVKNAIIEDSGKSAIPKFDIRPKRWHARRMITAILIGVAIGLIWELEILKKRIY